MLTDSKHNFHHKYNNHIEEKKSNGKNVGKIVDKSMLFYVMNYWQTYSFRGIIDESLNQVKKKFEIAFKKVRE